MSAVTPSADAPFVPRRGRAMAIISGVIATVLAGVIALLLPGPEVGGKWGPMDKLMVWSLGLAIAALMVRYALIKAWPQEDGLRVRNLILTQTLPWSEIEDVRFGGGEPWVMIEMAEGESVSVMAIQRADGPLGVAEAARLAALVDAHHGGSPSA